MKITEKLKKLKKPTWIAVLIISAVVLATGAYLLISYLTQDDIGREDITSSEYPTSAPRPYSKHAQEHTEAPTEPGPVKAYGQTLDELENVDVSFDELMEINPDVYAWIFIPNTNVDYPVAQSLSDWDDSFYLSHNIYKQYQFSGTIYSETQNSTDFHDRVTVLYGHNMLNGSMFATLHYFEDEDFFNDNNTIFILTKYKQLTYLVYSVYTYDDRHILNSFNFKDDKVFQEYIDTTLDPHTYSGLVREGVEPDLDSKILTLSTCTNGAANTRLLVQGVLVDERDR